MDAGTLNCPTCGAAISSDSPRCGHCGTKLATVACPSCFGRAFIGSKFCAHCGKALTWTDQVQTGLSCPRCIHEEMRSATLKETKLLECPKCSGLWVTIQTFEHICNSQEEQVAVLALNALGASVTDVDAQRRYLPCPNCGDLMNRINFAQRSGVMVDICSRHGAWFDRDELRRIIEFIRKGGLTRAREIEQQKLAGQIRSLEGMASALPVTSPVRDSLQSEIANAIASTRDLMSQFLR